MNRLELKNLFKNTFNIIAHGYDNTVTRFFPESALQISSYLHLHGDEHILDVATGTGWVALTLAKNLPHGHVTGIDFSSGMLSQAIRKKEERRIHNVTFVEMDMDAIDFPDNYFDAAVSGFGIFFVKDLKKQLIHIAQKVKNNGTIVVSTFFDNAFSPLVNLFLDRLRKYGIEVPLLAWKRVATKEQCISLFREAGLESIQCEQFECGYFLPQASDWWYIIRNGGLWGLLNQLSPTDLIRFKQEHEAEVNELAIAQGIRLEMNILFTSGMKIIK